MKVIIDIPETEFNHIKKVWSKRRGSIPYTNVAFGTPIPDNATNGDVIKVMFPNAKWWVNEDNEVFTDMPWKPEKCIYFDLDWWNAPYKTESEDKE